MMFICKPLADIEADYLAAVAASNCTELSLSTARDTALAELRGSWGLSYEEGKRLLFIWLAGYAIQEKIINVPIVKATATAA